MWHGPLYTRNIHTVREYCCSQNIWRFRLTSRSSEAERITSLECTVTTLRCISSGRIQITSVVSGMHATALTRWNSRGCNVCDDHILQHTVTNMRIYRRHRRRRCHRQTSRRRGPAHARGNDVGVRAARDARGRLHVGGVRVGAGCRRLLATSRALDEAVVDGSAEARAPRP